MNKKIMPMLLLIAAITGCGEKSDVESNSTDAASASSSSNVASDPSAGLSFDWGDASTPEENAEIKAFELNKESLKKEIKKAMEAVGATCKEPTIDGVECNRDNIFYIASTLSFNGKGNFGNQRGLCKNGFRKLDALMVTDSKSTWEIVDDRIALMISDKKHIKKLARDLESTGLDAHLDNYCGNLAKVKE